MKAKWLRPGVLGCAWAVLSVGLAGCLPRKDIPGPSRGKQDVLFFFTNGYWGPVANGLEEDLLIPASLSNPEGRGHITYDFEGTTLDVEADAGLTVLRTWQSPSHSHHLTFRCEPSEEAARTLEVRVRVRAPDGAVRYADATDVRCGQPGQLRAEVRTTPRDAYNADGFYWASGTLPVKAALVGAKLAVKLDLLARDGTSLGSLVGRGPLEWVGWGTVLRRLGEGPLSLPGPLLVEAVAPGEPPRVRFAGFEVPLDVEVVKEDAVQLRMGIEHDTSTLGWTFQARLVKTANAATEVAGLEEDSCSFEVRPKDGASFVKQGACRIYVESAVGPGTVCLTIAGRSWPPTCAEYRR